MQVFNDTAFAFGAFPGRIDYPGHSLTLIVKGTFDLVPGGVAVPGAEQLPLSPDQPYPDDPGEIGSVRYDSDFVAFKPAADLLLVGSCHTPGGRPATRCRVGFSVGDRSHSLEVIGDRFWDGGGLLRPPSATEPRPFREMPLRYEFSFGGAADPRNPVGRGAAVPGQEGGARLPLPNIEDPKNAVTSPKSRPAPAGCGPLRRTWAQRVEGMGTYDDAYVQRRFPWVPENFDWSSCNTAPPALRVKGYLRGDEEIRLENVHPERSSWMGRLPGLRVRCFLFETGGAFREVAMHLDTLWIDAHAAKLVLVWRGHANVSSNEYEEVGGLVIGSEPVGGPTRDEEAFRALLPQPAPPVVETAAAIPGQPAELHEDLARDLTTESSAEGDVPGGLTLPQDPEARLLQIRIMRVMGLRDAAIIEAGFAKLELPALTPAEIAAMNELRARLNIPEEPVEPEAPAADPAEERWTKERVVRAASEGRSLRGMDLSGLDLSGLSLSNADLERAILREAVLDRADLTGASLVGADLRGGNLRGACLKGAKLLGALVAGARLDGADLEGADFSNADLSQATLNGARGPRASFEAARLDGASLQEGSFEGAAFVGASLVDADLRAANLKRADLEGAVGRGANLTGATLEGLRSCQGADFSGACFREVRAPESSWAKANLESADFSHAELQRADFSRARLRGATLDAADAREGVFYRADLEQATVVEANLFHAIFEQAVLVGTDLSRANLYGAYFVDARIESARTEGAILDRAMGLRR